MKLFKAKQIGPSGLCCVSRNETGVAVAYAVTQNGGIDAIQQFSYLPCESDDNKKINPLPNFVSSNNLQAAACHYVLQASDYRLFLLDVPNVPEAERKNAARWLIRDLIDYPIEEAAIDLFEIPSEQKPKMYVVVMRLPQLEEIAKSIESAGLRLEKINIAELALNQLISHNHPGEEAAALVYAEAKVMRLIISKQGIIRMVREIGETAEMLRPENHERLVEALKRSFEFYQSQMETALPTKLILVPELGLQENLVKCFAEHLPGMPVAVMQLPGDFAGKLTTLPEQSIHALAVLGEAMNYTSGKAENSAS